MGFLRVFENIPCKATYSVKIGVWNNSQTMWDSFQISTLMQKNSLFSFWNSLYVGKIKLVCRGRFMCAYSEGFLGLIFSKIYLFAH